MRKASSTRLAPHWLTSLAAAAAVPPVARTSSRMMIRSPGLIAYSQRVRVFAPYSRV